MKKVVLATLMLAILAMLTVVSTGAAFAAAPSTSLEVKGTISAVDTVAKTVQIAPKEGSSVTVKVDASTVITKSGLGKTTIGSLAKDDRAVATYDKITFVASRIVVSYPLAKHHSFVGTIKETPGATSFVVTTKKGDATINVNGETKYKVPGVKDATLANFVKGDKVAVLAAEVNGGNLALHVVLIPAKPVIVQRVGTITNYQAGVSITFKDKKGETSTFIVTSNTKIVLKKGATAVTVGEEATVIARRVPPADQFTATTIVVFGSK